MPNAVTLLDFLMKLTFFYCEGVGTCLDTVLCFVVHNNIKFDSSHQSNCSIMRKYITGRYLDSKINGSGENKNFRHMPSAFLFCHKCWIC